MLRRSAATLAAAFVLASCGGGGGGGTQIPVGPVNTNASPTPKPAANTMGAVAFTVVIPGASTSASARAPRYVSPGTASLTVTLQGATSPLATVNLTPTSPGCSTVAAGTSCLVTANAPVGSDTFVVTTFGGANGTGQQLSTATIAAVITQNATNVVPLTLGGIVAGASVILGTTSVPVGSPATVSVTVVATDAAGNMIVGPGNYSSPIALTNSDTTGVTTLSAASAVAPGTNLTLTYNGNSLNGATITPSVNGKAGTAATLQAIGYAFVTYTLPSSNLSNVAVMAPGPDGNVWFGSDASGTSAFIGKISTNGQATEYAAANGVPNFQMRGLAAGPDGNLWFGDASGDIGSISTTGMVTLASTLNNPLGCGVQQDELVINLAIARRPQGARQPQVVKHGLLCGNVNSIVAGPDGNLWFSDDNGLIGKVTTAGVVTEWDITQLVGWTLGNASEPAQLAFASDGKLYVADFADGGSGGVDQITISGATPTVIQVPLTSGCQGFGLTVGPDNNVWFTDNCANVGMIPPGNFTAGGMLQWSFAGETGNSNIPLTTLIASPGGVWLTDDAYSVYRLSNLAGVSASTSPTLTPLHPFGNLQQYPFAICLGPDGNIWVSEDYGPPTALAKIAYGAPGTGTQSIVRALPLARRMR